ncbi:MAG: phospholipase [Firmicutes bacterium]|nr:phospholipase [Bacillota bacterium]
MSQITEHRLKGTIVKPFELPYALYLPRGYAEGGEKRWPLLIFLHGAGERGEDLELVARHGPLKQVREGQDFPYIIVAPQCRENVTWDRMLDELDQFLLDIINNYSVDTERIYLTGLSMGGFGTWHWAVHQPNAFAALVPICGGTWWLLGFPQRIAVLKDIPIWAFHGDADEVVPVKMTEDLVQVLMNLNAPVRFTRYSGVGHDSWTLAYNEPELVPWLLEQRNPQFRLRSIQDGQGD